MDETPAPLPDSEHGACGNSLCQGARAATGLLRSAVGAWPLSPHPLSGACALHAWHASARTRSRAADHHHAPLQRLLAVLSRSVFFKSLLKRNVSLL